ncbi:transketolase subunit B [Sphingomonas sp. BK036]|uniref:transketolase family protein n=1 Tax=Sphingomonas sp. BK036 TaxID=2512122 RepID=UPI0010290152|nr:transketolase C-terminal domain-containing protein [Sphingomonas sp. BK036]RZT44864.1 transketolase subunit B [Sphingomonas sp. BK036]
MRDAFSNSLVRLADADPRVLLLTGDHGYALFDTFRAAHPDRYINAGIAEQNMVGMAAGLARMGFHPFVYGLSAFVPVRVLEQIKLDVAHDNLPVVFCGDGAGFVYSTLGTSHQALEDIACIRAVPGMMVLSPADRHELSAAMDHAHGARLSVYLRMGKADRGDIHADGTTIDTARLQCLRPGRDGGTVILATGPIATTALAVADRIEGVGLWSAPSIKPFDTETLATICRSAGRLVTMEEHSVMGGFGSLVTEEVSAIHPLHVLRIGVQDRFSEHCGSYEYLLREHGLDLETVTAQVRAYDAG